MNRATIQRNAIIKNLIYKFFLAKYLLSNDQVTESLEIFIELSHKIKKRYHLFYEIEFQLGKIYLKMDNREKATQYFEKIYHGFEKYQYEEPLREIEKLRVY